MSPLKYLNNFRVILEMSLIDCEINLELNQSKICIILKINGYQETIFSIINTKLCAPVVTLSSQDNTITGININKKNQQKNKANIQITQLTQVLKEEIDFWLYYLKMKRKKQDTNDIIFRLQK